MQIQSLKIKIITKVSGKLLRHTVENYYKRRNVNQWRLLVVQFLIRINCQKVNIS